MIGCPRAMSELPDPRDSPLLCPYPRSSSPFPSPGSLARPLPFPGLSVLPLSGCSHPLSLQPPVPQSRHTSPRGPLRQTMWRRLVRAAICVSHCFPGEKGVIGDFGGQPGHRAKDKIPRVTPPTPYKDTQEECGALVSYPTRERKCGFRGMKTSSEGTSTVPVWGAPLPTAM